MKHIILATDVATHLAQMAQFEKMVETGLDTANIDHRNHLLSLCMTASDLSDQTKDWSTTVRTSVGLCCWDILAQESERK